MHSKACVDRGRLQVIALFDKPDPLDGPFFEETIYTTPSRATTSEQDAIVTAIGQAIESLGLTHGPIHAECRVGPSGVTVLEIAARPIGGLCAKAVEVVDGSGHRLTLEALLLRHAIGENIGSWRPAAEGSAVMMVPIPGEGVYRGVVGVDGGASGRACHGRPDHGEDRSGADAAAGRGDLSGVHLRAGGHGRGGRARRARRARETSLPDRPRSPDGVTIVPAMAAGPLPCAPTSFAEGRSRGAAPLLRRRRIPPCVWPPAPGPLSETAGAGIR